MNKNIIPASEAQGDAKAAGDGSSHNPSSPVIVPPAKSPAGFSEEDRELVAQTLWDWFRTGKAAGGGKYEPSFYSPEMKKSEKAAWRERSRQLLSLLSPALERARKEGIDLVRKQATICHHPGIEKFVCCHACIVAINCDKAEKAALFR